MCSMNIQNKQKTKFNPPPYFVLTAALVPPQAFWTGNVCPQEHLQDREWLWMQGSLKLLISQMFIASSSHFIGCISEGPLGRRRMGLGEMENVCCMCVGGHATWQATSVVPQSSSWWGIPFRAVSPSGVAVSEEEGEGPLLGLPQPLPFTNEETEVQGAELTYVGLHSSSEAIFLKLSFWVADTRVERGIDGESN